LEFVDETVAELEGAIPTSLVVFLFEAKVSLKPLGLFLFEINDILDPTLVGN
jgi:hypothetical protein